MLADPFLAGYGLHSCELIVSDPDAVNSPRVIDVNFTVVGPSLGISQSSYSFMASKETVDPDGQVLTISNLVLEYSAIIF